MNKKSMIMLGMTSFLSLVLVGCGKSTTSTSEPKDEATPLTVQKQENQLDTVMQGTIHYSSFDENNEVKAKVQTTPDAKISLKERIPKSRYSYDARKIDDKGNYEVIFKNKGIRNEDKYPVYNDIVAKSPSYTKESQAPIGLHPSSERIKQAIVKNINEGLKKDGVWDDELQGKATVSVDGHNYNHDLNVIINSSAATTVTPPVNVISSALKSIRNIDMSTLNEITLSIDSNGQSAYWYSFLPYTIKTMPLNNLDSKDLRIISTDNSQDMKSE